MKYCNGCKKETKEVVWDDSFDYAPTHCAPNGGTHHDSHKASECCDDSVNDGRYVQCKCGHEMEVSENASLHLVQCPACKRIGMWETEY